MAFLALLVGILAASPSLAATSTGWIRFGNLSATTSPVDAYLYSSGNSSPQLVLHDLAYGAVSGQEVVSAGTYTVMMRPAGSSPSSQPILSTSVTVQPGHSITVAPLSVTGQGRHIMVFDNSLTTPSGESLVRVIVASIDQKQVTFHCSCAPGPKGNIVTDAQPGSVSPYAPIPPGNWTMTATGTSAKTSLPVPLTADTVRTEIVIDAKPSGIEIINVLDSAGTGQPPAGGVSTGFGGTAPHGPGSPLPWQAMIGAGVLLTLAGGLALGRSRLRRSATRV